MEVTIGRYLDSISITALHLCSDLALNTVLLHSVSLGDIPRIKES